MTTPSWFTALIAKIDEEAKAVEAEAVKVANELGPIVTSIGEEFFSALAQIALGAVLKQAPLVLSGSEKFGAAVADVIMQVEAQGKSLAVQDAQAIVQASFNSLKNVIS